MYSVDLDTIIMYYILLYDIYINSFEDICRKTVGKKEVSVAVTPNGYADAPNNGYFVMPEERTMQLASFLEVMEKPGNHSGVRSTIMP